MTIEDDESGNARALNTEADEDGWYRLAATASLAWVDEYGVSKTYQDFEDLNAIITSATETYEAGGDDFDSTLWSAFENAYEVAVKVSGYTLGEGGTVSNENSVKSANQVEIDYREEQLGLYADRA